MFGRKSIAIEYDYCSLMNALIEDAQWHNGVLFIYLQHFLKDKHKRSVNQFLISPRIISKQTMYCTLITHNRQ